MSSSQDPSPMALDLSRRCTVRVSPLHPSHTENLNLVRHPEWYRTPQSRSSEVLGQSSGNGGRHRGTPLSHGLGIDLLPKALNSNVWAPGFYEPESSVSSISDSNDGNESQSDSDVIFLVSTTRDTLLCRSFSSDTVSPIVDPLSPAAPSGDEGRGCFLLPQTLSSPSPGYTNSEDSSDSMGGTLFRSSPALQLPRFVNPLSAHIDTSGDDSDVVEVPVTNAKSRVSCEKRLFKTCVALDRTVSPPQREPRRSARVRKDTSSIHKPSNSVYIHHLKSSAKSTNAGLHNEDSDCGDMDYTGKLSDSDEKSWVRPTVMQRIGMDSEVHEGQRVPLKSLQRESSASRSKPETSRHNNKRKADKPLSKPRTKRSRAKGTQKKTKKLPPKKFVTVNKDGEKNYVNKRRRRKRQRPTGPSSTFSPVEPEIRLKYANYKRERKDHKSDKFSPFVHVEHKEYTVVNYQEEELLKGNRGNQHTSTSSFSTIIPKSSCFRLGRLSSGRKSQLGKVCCCLCGVSANASGLGDLHGPYYPVGSGLRHQSKGEKGIALLAETEENGFLSNGHVVEPLDEECILVSENTKMPFPRELAVVDSHCQIEMAQLTEEHWVHEDCSIWSTGVYLVKGKLYGLEEAARLAQETVCSTCYNTGATMGCFFKGCPAKYHYTCAIQTECLLNEDNFSLRCCKHKDKPLRGVNR